MPTIEKIDAAAFHYLQAWNVRAVCLSPTGRVYSAQNPQGATACWWVAEQDAARLVEVAQRSGDVVDAARRLHVRLTTHDRAVAKAQERSAALAGALQRAQQDGLLPFNAAYRERRLQAFRAGQNYMPYATARTKLMQAIASAIAQGGPVSKSVLLAVFD